MDWASFCRLPLDWSCSLRRWTNEWAAATRSQIKHWTTDDTHTRNVQPHFTAGNKWHHLLEADNINAPILMFVTQSSFGHRQEFDWFGVGGKSGCFLQSSQDLRVLQKKKCVTALSLSLTHFKCLKSWSSLCMCVCACNTPCRPVRRRSPAASSASCSWGRARLRPSAAAPPAAGVRPAPPHGGRCCPEGLRCSPTRYSARARITLALKLIYYLAIVTEWVSVCVCVCDSSDFNIKCLPVTRWWRSLRFHRDRRVSEECCHSDPSCSVWRCTRAETSQP